MKKLFALVAVLAAFTAQANEKLVVGASPVPHAEILEFVKPQLAQEGVDLDIKVFSDFIQPNVQLAEKTSTPTTTSTDRFWMSSTRPGTPIWCR